MTGSNITLPIPPTVVAKVIKMAADPDCNVADLGKVVKADPVLSIQMLKAVNSPYYGLRKKMSAVERAVGLMGIRAVRNLVLCFGIQKLSPPKSDYPLELFWEFSLRRAAAAKELALRLNIPEPDEMFTLGLCQDLAVLALISGSDESAEAQSKAARQPLLDRRRIEQQFGKSHDELGGEMFEEWEFPPSMIAAVRFHHSPEDAPEEFIRLARVASAADHLADVLEVDDKKAALDSAVEKIELLGMAADDISPLMDTLSQAVTEAADMLQIKVGHQPSYQEIAAQASQGLLSLNMSYQELTEELQDSLKNQKQLAQRLEQLNQDLERRAMTDELTGLPNRRAFDEAMEREIERAKRIDKPLCVLMMDVDKFKVFNDTYGHQAGDAVLQKVGRAIATASRACDFPARYGGEEFCIILPHTPPDGGRIAGERVRRSIEKMVVEYEGKHLKVTISIGVAQVDPEKGKRAAVIGIRSADDALYEAKEAGRNRVWVFGD